MPELLTSSAAHRTATVVGVATTAIGGALLAAPGAAGPLMRLTDPRGARVVGLADLVLVPGLLAGRPRWPWMAARAVLNPAIAAYVLRIAPRSGRTKQARAVASVLAVATLADGAAAYALRRSAGLAGTRG